MAPKGISSNAAAPLQLNWCSVYWSGTNLGNDHYSEVTVGTLTGGSGLGPMVRMKSDFSLKKRLETYVKYVRGENPASAGRANSRAALRIAPEAAGLSRVSVLPSGRARVRRVSSKVQPLGSNGGLVAGTWRKTTHIYARLHTHT